MSSSSNDNEDWKKGGRRRNPNSPKEKSLDSRCSPSDFSKIMQEIGENDLQMAEVIAMGFRDLEDMPNWTVKQEFFLHLASRFDLENNLIKDDVGMIDVNASVSERAIGLPLYGIDFPDYDPGNIRTAALKLRWGPVTLKVLKAFVIRCPMEM
ncbi:hypothetical protein PIB30_024944 [Stylosanthes scabra]|uniref:Uncharacterized protein n=1 Tax=Stylosanthes scabra TaxID=79078 RepID=A0ABU6VC40_9FABA|nr:hypothetical protein [Stylosanthes scabra]